MNEILRVLKVEQNKKPEVVLIEKSFEALQREVEGNIKSIIIDDGISLIYNEIPSLSMKPNRELRDSEGHIYDIILGPFLIAGIGVDDGDFRSLNNEELKRYYEKFRYPRESFRLTDEEIKRCFEKSRNPREGFRLIGDQIQVYEIDDTLGMIFQLDEFGHRKGS